MMAGAAGRGILASCTTPTAHRRPHRASSAAPIARVVRVTSTSERQSTAPSRKSFGKRVRSFTVTRADAGDDSRTTAARNRLDAIKEEDELDVEDPGERGGFDMFSGGTFTPEVLQYWVGLYKLNPGDPYFERRLGFIGA